MQIEMRWLGTACFEMLLPNGKTLVTDPYVDDADLQLEKSGSQKK